MISRDIVYINNRQRDRFTFEGRTIALKRAKCVSSRAIRGAVRLTPRPRAKFISSDALRGAVRPPNALAPRQICKFSSLLALLDFRGRKPAFGGQTKTEYNNTKYTLQN